MSDFMQEVQEDLRRQKMHDFWKENQNWIIGGILLAIVSTGTMAWWRTYSYNKDMQATAQFLQVSAKNDAAALETYAATADKDHAILARLQAAELELQKGKTEEAVKMFDAIAATRMGDSDLRDLAKIYALQQRLDTEDADKLHAQLKPLMGDKAPWRFTAREMNALVFAREGKMKEAAAEFALISGDAEAPQNARTRAFTLHELYQGNAEAMAGEAANKKTTGEAAVKNMAGEAVNKKTAGEAADKKAAATDEQDTEAKAPAEAVEEKTK